MTHHSSSCERRALYKSGVKNSAFNSHDCRPGLDKNLRHVQVLQQMDCAAQGGISSFPSSTPGVGPRSAATLLPTNSRSQGRGLRGQLCSDPWPESSKATTQINLEDGRDFPSWMEKCLDCIYPFSFTLETANQK